MARWLILLLLALGMAGALLLNWLYSPSRFRVVEPTDSFVGVDSGTFVMEEQGKKIVEESFALQQGQKMGWFRLQSRALLTSPDQPAAEMTQLLILSPQLQPVSYGLDLSANDGKQKARIEAVVDEKSRTAGMSVKVVWLPPLRKEVTLDKEPYVFDVNLVSSYYILFELLKRRAVETLSLTALVPPRLSSWPLKVSRTGSITLSTPSGEVQAERYTVQAGDLGEIDLYAHGGQLIGIRSAMKDWLAYRSDLFAQGFKVVEGPPQQETPPKGVVEIAVQFESVDLKLAGTLALPQTPGQLLPAVLLFHGSGPVDRNENAKGFRSDIFKQIAYYLAQHGIASLRYDKRGIGVSQGDFSKASMEDLLEDARAALEYLKRRLEIDRAQIFLLGHSEGGILAPILAAEGQVAGLITIAAPARPLDQIILWQLEEQLRAAGAQGALLQQELEKQRQFIAFVKQSQGEWADYTLEMAKRSMPWLSETQWKGMQGLALSWYRQQFQHDPLATIRQIRVPVLILQGAKDIQVPKEEAERLAQALREAGNSQVTVEVLSDLNHLLRHHPEEAGSGYSHLDQPMDERLLTRIVGWIMNQSPAAQSAPTSATNSMQALQ